MLRLICALGAALSLGACLPVDEFTQQKIDARRAAARQTHEMAQSPAEVQRLLSDTTTKVWNAHGTQIEYLASDGTAHLWYPGNAQPVVGYWKLQQPRHGTEICFRYGPQTYNPITRQRGEKWECDLAAYYILNRDEIITGDPLHLKRRVPFVMPKSSNISVPQAAEQAGFAPIRASNRAPAPQHPKRN